MNDPGSTLDPSFSTSTGDPTEQEVKEYLLNIAAEFLEERGYPTVLLITWDIHSLAASAGVSSEAALAAFTNIQELNRALLAHIAGTHNLYHTDQIRQVADELLSAGRPANELISSYGRSLMKIVDHAALQRLESTANTAIEHGFVPKSTRDALRSRHQAYLDEVAYFVGRFIKKSPEGQSLHECTTAFAAVAAGFDLGVANVLADPAFLAIVDKYQP